MAVNLYVMPAVGAGTHSDPRRAKAWSTTISSYVRAQMDLGLQDTFLVAVKDISGADDATLVADSTITAIPALGNTIGAGALATVKSELEALSLPADWVTSGMTYGLVVRYVALFCQLFQRMHGQGVAKLISGGVTLDTTFGSLSAGVRTQLLAMANSFSFDVGSLTGASTLRQIFKALADQMPGSLSIGGLVEL